MATVAIGQMNRLATFQTNAAVSQGAGKKDAYSTLLTAWGRLKDLSGRRTNDEGEKTQVKRWEFICYVQSAIEGSLSISLKVIIGTVTMSIESYEKIDDKNFQYRFILNSAISSGYP